MFSVNSFANQRLIFFLANSFKKVGGNVWLICFKALILHPLSREKGNAVEILEQRKGYEPKLIKTFRKIFFKKFCRFKIKPYLCTRFRKESQEEEFFERFRYEQASSTSLALNEE